jgi:hypothetical protein
VAALVIVLPVAASGCGPLRLPTRLPAGASMTTSVVHLPGGLLELHLAAPAVRRPGVPLVLYASGDGGWFGAAVGMFRSVAADGYPAVGFSTRAFLRLAIDRRAHVRGQVARAYATIVAQARQRLGLPGETPVVLTGWSRGASLAAIAAGPLIGSERVQGVVAIGLDDGDDLAVDDQASDDDDRPEPGKGGGGSFDTFMLLRALAPTRSSVIQSTRDEYLPASAARVLFGPDTDVRRFFAVEARNHRFSGAAAPLETALRDALAWVSDGPVPPPCKPGA